LQQSLLPCQVAEAQEELKAATTATAGGSMRRAGGRAEVGEADIATVISKWTGVGCFLVSFLGGVSECVIKVLDASNLAGPPASTSCRYLSL
jgi:hypothetical protein